MDIIPLVLSFSYRCFAASLSYDIRFLFDSAHGATRSQVLSVHDDVFNWNVENTAATIMYIRIKLGCHREENTTRTRGSDLWLIPVM